MANIRGNVLGDMKTYVERTFGPEALERWLGELPPADAAVLRGLLLPSSWYPIGVWNRAADRFVFLFGGSDPRSFRPVAERVALNDFRSFFKLLPRSTPASVLRRAGSIWDRYFDVGKMVPEEQGPSRFMVRLTAPTAQDEGPGPITCTAAVLAWQEWFLSHVGAKRGKAVHQACRFHGARACEFTITWG